VCYATSHDGIEWDRPALDVVKGTNITLNTSRDSSTVWLDALDPDPDRRFKLSIYYDHYLVLYASRDGIHWRELGRTGQTGDRSTFFYNPFRKVWVFSLREGGGDGLGRGRRYWESPVFDSGHTWKPRDPVLWATADSGDPERPDYHTTPELYNLDGVAYESVLLGLFTIWRGERPFREKPNEVCLGFSRDGFHWDRPDRRAFLPVSEHVGDRNWANVQSAGGCCLVVGDRLYFYVSGRHGVPGTSEPGVCSTGLAMLRRDGFAALVDPAPAGAIVRVRSTLEPGTIVTRPVRFNGRYLHVNVDCPDGELHVEVLDTSGRVLPSYAMAQCVPVRTDSTSARVIWTSAEDLAPVAGEPVRFRFRLRRGSLYAFWVSATRDGASGGYVAAGGPGFAGPIDAGRP
jgi:hypothetical protein